MKLLFKFWFTIPLCQLHTLIFCWLINEVDIQRLENGFVNEKDTMPCVSPSTMMPTLSLMFPKTLPPLGTTCGRR